jgi:hypothetical protein
VHPEDSIFSISITTSVTVLSAFSASSPSAAMRCGEIDADVRAMRCGEIDADVCAMRCDVNDADVRELRCGEIDADVRAMQ